MIEGIDRTVDLIGVSSSGLSGAGEQDIVTAIRRCDTAALAATDGHFAAIARDGRTVRLARTIGIPLRYFVAKMYHGPFLVVSDRIDRIFDWCQSQRIGWQFDPVYTRMVPAHYVVELDQVGCPDPSPRISPVLRSAHRPWLVGPRRSRRGLRPCRVNAVRGVALTRASSTSRSGWRSRAGSTAPPRCCWRGTRARRSDVIPIPFVPSRSTSAAGRTRRRPSRPCARLASTSAGSGSTWRRSGATSKRRLRVIEDYHPLDVECAAAGLCLLRGIRERYPSLTYMLDGDGGDENLKAYPLEDSDLTLSSVLRNPLLYQEGWGVDAIKHSPVYSGGLSRGYVRTYAPASALGFTAFSPFSVRSVIAAAAAIPFEQVLAGQIERLYTLKQDVVSAGIRSVLGVDMPVNPKRRFQDGAGARAARASPRPGAATCSTRCGKSGSRTRPMRWTGDRETRCLSSCER